MKVSVIVPIYNVENFVEECLNSLRYQTLSDIEVILVNDGSTDNSIGKIKHLLDSCNYFKLINQENAGLSAARNTGLKYATGEYIAFVDSDDYVEPTFLEELYNTAIEDNLDIVMGGYKKFQNNCYEEIRRNSNLYDTVMTGIEFLKSELKYDDYRMEVWDDLYRSEFLKEYNLKFEEGLLHEDELFTPLAFLQAKRVKLIESNKYIYRQRENSIMSNTPNINHIKSYSFIINEFLNIFEDTSSPDIKYILSKLLINLCGGYEVKIFKSDRSDKKLLLNKLRNAKLINALNYGNSLSPKQKFRYFLLKMNFDIFYLYVKKIYQIKNKEVKP
ncbi:glycosyltransferase [Turicibacter sp. GALT-G1]|uniref:glycosyltransferase n=1 Tax=Turicibacter sp. GALT-G1 TaxID=2951140 RepID=UPI0021D50CDB|nr:glycosyltransferase [Turicibacter sp. GALT-G1]MCU7207418.1 glycosyltransferase [Turicibacter sp. GALT-G1]